MNIVKISLQFVDSSTLCVSPVSELLPNGRLSFSCHSVADPHTFYHRGSSEASASGHKSSGPYLELRLAAAPGHAAHQPRSPSQSQPQLELSTGLRKAFTFNNILRRPLQGVLLVESAHLKVLVGKALSTRKMPQCWGRSSSIVKFCPVPLTALIVTCHQMELETRRHAATTYTLHQAS